MAITVEKIIEKEKMPIPVYSRSDSLTSKISDVLTFKPTVGDLIVKNNLTGERDRYNFNDIVKLISITVGTIVDGTDISIPRTNLYYEDYIIYMNDNGLLSVSYNCQRVGFVVRQVGGRTLMTTDQPEPNKNCMYTIYTLPKDDVPLDIGYVDAFRYKYNGFDFGSTNPNKSVSLHLRSSLSLEFPAGSYTVYTAKWDYLRDNPKSDEILIEITKKLETPNTLPVEYFVPDDTSATLSWESVEGADEYSLQLGLDGEIVYRGSELSYATNQIGEYILRAHSNNPYLLDSNPTIIRVTKQEPLDRPSLVLTDDELEWTSVPYAIGYELYKDSKLIASLPAETIKHRVVGYGSYYVKAIADERGIYNDSVNSNTVIYTKLSLTLYNNSAEPNRLDKTSMLANDIELTGTLRHTTSITNPIIEIAIFGPPTYNYAYIPSFGRYYFITDVQSIRTGFWELTLAVDALMSFKDKVLDTTGFISRSEVGYDNYISDDLNPVKSYILRSSKEIDVGFRNIVEDFDLDENGQPVSELPLSFAISVITTGARNANIADPTYANDWFGATAQVTFLCDIINARKILMKMQDPDFWTTSAAMFAGDATEAVLAIREYMIDFRDFFESSDYVQVNTINVPYSSNITEVTAYRIKSNKRIIFANTFSKSTLEISDYTDYPPFSKYILYLPFYGMYELDSKYFTQTPTITIQYEVELDGGTAVISIKSGTDVLDILDCVVGRDIPLNRTGAVEKAKEYVGRTIKGVGAIASIFSGIPMALPPVNEPTTKTERKEQQRTVNRGKQKISSGVSSLLESAGSKVSNISAGNSSNNVIYGIENFKVIIIKYKPNLTMDITDSNYLHLFGRPVKEIKRIGDCHKFTIIEDCHLENFDNALPDELEDISSALSAGVLLPD